MDVKTLRKILGMFAMSVTMVISLNLHLRCEDAAKDDKNKVEQNRIHKEVVVTATRTENEPEKIPQAITVLDKEALERKSPLSALDSLGHSIGLWVEKRTTTASDPVMRGMSGYRVLALINGNSLSTLWGEGGAAGDDMYGKIDSDSIEKIEVVRGPTSVLYGSNAMAGVINFFAKEPPLAFSEKGFRSGGLFKYVYGNAANENRLRGEIYGALPRFRFILGGSLKSVGDAQGGRGAGLLSPSGGKAKNMDFSAQYRPADNHSIRISFQRVDQDDLVRYYRPDERNHNDRDGLSVEYATSRESGFFTNLSWQLYFQHKLDRRIWQKTAVEGRSSVRTYASDLHLDSVLTEKHLLTYGIHYSLDDGESADDEQFTRYYPDGKIVKDGPDSHWQNFALYFQDQYFPVPGFKIILGLRWDRYQYQSFPDRYLASGSADNSAYQINDTQSSLCGGLSSIFEINEKLNLYLNISRGFHAPAPSFGIRQVGYGILIPSGLLKPEKSNNFEIGLKTRSNRFFTNLALYYTQFRDFIAIIPGRYLGSDWYDWNLNSFRDPYEDVYVAGNSARAYVFGTEIEGEIYLGKGYSLYAGFNWNYGNDETNKQPLRHTIPAFGLCSLKWENSRHSLWGELTLEAVGRYFRIPQDRIKNDPGYRSNPQDMNSPLITSDGHLPGYILLSLSGGMELSDKISLTAAVENMTNKRYRKAHSRMDGVGTNFQIGFIFKY